MIYVVQCQFPYILYTHTRCLQCNRAGTGLNLLPNAAQPMERLNALNTLFLGQFQNIVSRPQMAREIKQEVLEADEQHTLHSQHRQNVAQPPPEPEVEVEVDVEEEVDVVDDKQTLHERLFGQRQAESMVSVLVQG